MQRGRWWYTQVHSPLKFPRIYRWRNGLIRQLPTLQVWLDTRWGRHSACTKPALLVAAYIPFALYRNLPRAPSRGRYKTCPKQSSLQVSVLFTVLLYRGYSTPCPSSPASPDSQHRLLSAPSPPLQLKGSKCLVGVPKGCCIPRNCSRLRGTHYFQIAHEMLFIDQVF